MGLFHGLIKDSPATFYINAGRSIKGRVAKGRNKRVARAVRNAEAEYGAEEPIEDFLSRGAAYSMLYGVLALLGQFWLAGLLLVGVGALAYYALNKPAKGKHIA